jgi:multiple sugar transport system permease protein
MTISEDTPIALEPGGRPAPTMRSRPVGHRSGPQWLVYTALIIAIVVTLVPFIWIVLSSFKTQGEILRNPTGFFPADPTWENYATWFTELNIGKFYFNSLFVAVVTVLGNLVFCSMVGYALAQMEFPGKRLLFILVLICLMTPGVVTFVPLFVLVSKIGLVNTYPALILPFLTTPLGVFPMRQFMMGIPHPLIEAPASTGPAISGSSPGSSCRCAARRWPRWAS